jgi:ferric-dicitrate binding protein FerR (iron transport regulator)
MSGDSPLPQPYDDLINAYGDGEISDADLRRLEACLIESEEARRAFVEAFQFRTELHFAVRARHAADAAIEGLFAANPTPSTFALKHPLDRIWAGRFRWGLLTASIVLACLVGWAVLAKFSERRARLPDAVAGEIAATHVPGGNIAWLVNAQDCQWAEAESEMPGRDMKAGKQLRLLRGLAEIEFDRGARVILQGPANLELKSGSEALLHHGTLTARVPAQARGFTVLSPRGKVVDLGTEFGLSVDDAGATTVRVFTGVVVAFPLLSGPNARPSVTLNQNQSITIDGRTVALDLADS